MKKIREGNDFFVLWRIKENETLVDFSVVENIKLHYTINQQTFEYELFEILDDGVVKIEIKAEHFKEVGYYRFTLTYQYTDDSMSDFDRKKAVDEVLFRIVPHTSIADKTEDIPITSDIAHGLTGDSAYKTWLEEGHSGSKQDFLDWIQEPSVTAGNIAEQQGLIAEQQGNTAEQKGNYAKEQGDYAKEKGELVADLTVDVAQAESGRVTAESNRVSAENLREIAESERVELYGDMQQLKTDTTTAKNDANNAAQLATNATIEAQTATQEATTAASLADTARLAIQDDLELKANKEQEEWITPTLQNGWTEGSSGVKYKKDSFGVVRLDIAAGGGTGTIFTLPVGYRPNKVIEFACNSGGGFGVMRVLPSGAVSRLIGGGVYILGFGLTFVAE